MTISLYSSNTSKVSINFLNISTDLIQRYQKDEIYAIDINLDLKSFFEDYTGQNLFIIDDRYIIEESDLNYIEDEEGTIKYKSKYNQVKPYTKNDVMQVLKQLIIEGLSQIHIRDVTTDSIGETLVFTFPIGSKTIDDYKKIIYDVILIEIGKYKLPYSREAIENDVWNKIYSHSKRFRADRIEINDIELGLGRYKKYSSSMNKDDIGLFNICLYGSILDLFLSLLVLNEKIRSYDSIGSHSIRIVLDKSHLDFLAHNKSDIYLDDANRVLNINGNSFRLEINNNYYKLLKCLIDDNKSTLFKADELLKKIDIHSDGPYEYIKQAKYEIKKKHGKVVSDLINIKNKKIRLGVG